MSPLFFTIPGIFLLHDPEKLVPFLTEADPGYSKEGGLNPLGLYTVGDALGVRLVPGVRERMSDPRFLTAMVVGMVVCEGYPKDQLAADGKSEPWQVFEWYVVEGLVRTFGESGDVQGLPGVEKGRAAVRNGLPLAHSNYLKTAHVFGFHGVYRGLGEALGMFDETGPLGPGWELLKAWEADQGLKGFHGDGEAASWQNRLRQAVKDGLEQGATSRSAHWSGWGFMGSYLAPRASGAREMAVLRRQLFGEEQDPRFQVLGFLVSKSGQSIWAQSEHSERRFHEGLKEHASDEVRALLDAIMAYERFARLLQDAFDDCLHRLSQGARRADPGQLSEDSCVQRALDQAPEAFEEAGEALEAVDEGSRFRSMFAPLGTSSDGPSWTAALLDHHYRNQDRKSPDGKNPWFDRFDDGSVVVRPAYRREEGGRGDDAYVHFYRTRPLDAFARSLELTSA